VAYSVRDILWLRLFAVGASVISIPYFLLQPTTLRAPLVWTVVFAGINLIQLAPLYRAPSGAVLAGGGGSPSARVQRPAPPKGPAGSEYRILDDGCGG